MRININDIKVKEGRRVATAENIEKLAESLREIGMMNPVTVDRENALVAGLHRLEAAKLLDSMLHGGAPGKIVVPPRGAVTRLSSETYPVEPEWLSGALTFIHRNVASNLSASDVFAHLGLSHTIVEQTFRRILHTTVQKEIINSRIEEARHLLNTTAIPVAEVARLSGFSSAEYFCRTFVAHNGKSPGEWRKERLAADD